MPDFALEGKLSAGARGRRVRLIVGVDEAGRGPWAGPVVAAAVWLDPATCPPELSDRLDDCKRLAPALRARLHDALFDLAAEGTAAVGIGQASVAEIDDLNVLRASLAAMSRAVTDLEGALGRRPDAALVDGTHAPTLACPAEAVVKGDTRSLTIAAASVVAKVVRDRMMDDLARVHPGYGWERNRGYGTTEHRAALVRLGPTPAHRRSFQPVREAVKNFL